MSEVAVKASELWKVFKVYTKPRHWLYERILLGKRKYHRQVVALRDVSFEVKKGECFGIVGRNGAGKTTLLKVLAGISPPTKGKIGILGRLATLLELGSGFHPEFTGRENLRLNGMIAGFSSKELDEKIQQMIEFSELGDFIDLPVRTYSDGMYLRLGFSLAQALEPDIFLIDEALAVGDEHFRSKCLRRMLEMKEQGKTLIIASHDLTMIRGLCERGIYLKEGRVSAQGAINDVLSAYLEDIYQEALGEERKEGEWKRRGTGEARVVSVKMKNSLGEEVYVFKTGEEVEIEFEYEVKKDISDLLFGINIFRSDGVLILSTNQECAQLASEFGQKVEIDLPEKISAGHKGKVSYKFQNELLPARYQLSVNIFRGKSGACACVDEVFDVVRFEVQSPKVIDRGVFIPKASWKIS